MNFRGFKFFQDRISLSAAGEKYAASGEKYAVPPKISEFTRRNWGVQNPIKILGDKGSALNIWSFERFWTISLLADKTMLRLLRFVDLL